MREVIPVVGHEARAQFAADVQYYLTLSPRQLPSRYLYDALGSALFEAICQLPWYGITRAETRMLGTHGRAIFDSLPGLATLVELGPGSGQKLTTLVEAGRLAGERIDLHLVDISSSALDAATRALSALAGVDITTYEAAYETGLRDALARSRRGRALVLFLGSNIGNFDRPDANAFLIQLRASLHKGDALLLGADLVKPERELLMAYDDPLGVTAAFNRNLLVRINRELGGRIDLDAFNHRAVWNASESRVEMHLVSTRRQSLCIEAAELDIVIEAGESVWTESSYKYRADDVIQMVERAGLQCSAQWVDDESGFALTLAEAW